MRTARTCHARSRPADGGAGIGKAMVRGAPLKWSRPRVPRKPRRLPLRGRQRLADVMAGVNAAQVRDASHCWVVDGVYDRWQKVLVGRDAAPSA